MAQNVGVEVSRWDRVLSPLSGFPAMVWAGFWWIFGGMVTVVFWHTMKPTPFLVMTTLAAIVAARSGPLYGVITAPLAFLIVIGRQEHPSNYVIPGLGLLLACTVISWLAHSSRRYGALAASQKETIAQDREKLIEVEKALRAEAENANRMKDEFLATLSHELRTPLNSILGWATVLTSGKDVDPSVMEAAKVIQRNANQQAQLINDLLDLNRIIAGKIRLELQAVDVAKVIDTALDALEPQVAQKHIRLTKLIDHKVEPIRGDPARVQQVVTNLLTNAIKYTPRAGKISVALERVNSHIEITVSDTGRGIPPEVLPKLFQRFAQVQSEGHRDGGLGLGLAICRHLVELHGGSIHAKSPGVGMGSTFRVELPVPIHSETYAPSPERAHPAVSEEPEVRTWDLPIMKELNVLVVEDDTDSRDLLVHLLAQSGARVISASSGVDGLNLFAAHRPMLVVSDIGMPEMDGFEFMRRVRHLPNGERILAVAVTAFARPEDRRMALLSGYDFFVSKPLDPGELSAILHRALERLKG